MFLARSTPASEGQGSVKIPPHAEIWHFLGLWKQPCCKIMICSVKIRIINKLLRMEDGWWWDLQRYTTTQRGRPFSQWRAIYSRRMQVGSRNQHFFLRIITLQALAPWNAANSEPGITNMRLGLIWLRITSAQHSCAAQVRIISHGTGWSINTIFQSVTPMFFLVKQRKNVKRNL